MARSAEWQSAAEDNWTISEVDEVTITITTTLETIVCCNSECGIQFAVPSRWEEQRRADHSWFFCPNGHRQHFPSETAEEKLRRERDIARQQVARAEQERDAARARTAEEMAARHKAENAAARLKKRTAAGSCPCCKRTFSNMAVHMRKQHPEYVAENVVKLDQKRA